MMDDSKFKDGQGRWFTLSLFLEKANVPEAALYSIRGYDNHKNGKDYPSLRRLYVEEGDVTEYIFANKYLGGWEHWLQLQECNWLKPYIDEWRKELEVKIKAEAIRGVIQEAKSGSKNALAACKWLADKKLIGENSRKKVKEEIKEKVSAEIEEHIVALEQYRNNVKTA